MKQEEVNQAVASGGLVLIATGKLREKILERTRRLVDGVMYVTLSDLLREINEIRQMLSRMRNRGKHYAVAVEAQIAQSIMLALLLVPELPQRQSKLPMGDKTGDAGTANGIINLARAADDARRVAERLWGAPEAVPTIEKWDRELSKLDDGGKLAEQLLLARRTEGAQAYGPNGQPFVELPVAPKALPSEEIHEVVLHIRTVDAETGIALVRVMRADHPDGPAMKGLFERRVPLAFDSEKRPGVAKLLELAQATDIHLLARVNVTRGLSPANAKLDKLDLAEVVREAETRQRVARRLLEMNAVTEDLFSEQEE